MINVWIFHYCICFTFQNIFLYVCKYHFSWLGHWAVYTDLGYYRLGLLSERGRESQCALPRQPHDAAQSCRKNSTEPIPSWFPGHLKLCCKHSSVKLPDIKNVLCKLTHKILLSEKNLSFHLMKFVSLNTQFVEIPIKFVVQTQLICALLSSLYTPYCT